jgi:hypothetical protein
MQPESRQYGDFFVGSYQGSLHHAGLYVPVQLRHATSRRSARQYDPWRCLKKTEELKVCLGQRLEVR